MGIFVRRVGAAGLTAVFVAGLLAGIAPAVAVAESGPSVPLPPIPSVPVESQSMGTRPTDQATTWALKGEQKSPAAPDGGGTSTATSLAPSATWDVAEYTGDFSWSYPLRVPPAAGGLEPDLALSYRSSAVDGRTSATNNQASWVGDGWDVWPGYVERSYGACADDTEGGTTPPRAGDLCWRSDNAVASYSGSGGMLIRDDRTGEWRSKNDDGSRIERIVGGAGHGNGDADGEYWRITSVDGTQFLFGSQPASSSTWTAPVFGDDTGEPCHAATFDTSHCVQAWRWNLDKVIDRNGNVIRYYYDTESNSYGMNRADTAVSYVRGGTLNRIEYGLRDDLPNNPATGRVVFATADRCVKDSVCAFDHKPNWPDTPLDDRCVASTCPDHHSPTFWTTKRLASVTTQVRRGADYDDVDRWTLGQEFPDPGDGEKAALWLRSITHTGLLGDGSIDLPAVTFEGTKMANRVDKVDGVGPLNRYRITGVVSETGGALSVEYASECRANGPMPANPESNTLRCFPARWTKRDFAERTDYFHKYVVTRTVQSDRLSTSTQQVTSYEYLDGAAWHWDMSEFAKDDKKTWNEFRGYGRVRTRTGVANDPAGPISLTEQRFYRGMDGDRLPSGTRPATVSDSAGGTYVDRDWLQGFGFETTTFNGDGGAAVARTISEPSWEGPTAVRGPYQAYQVHPGVVRGYTALESGGWRTTRSETTYDDRGLPTKLNDLGDTTTTDDDLCTRTTYVRNTTQWLLSFPSEVETVSLDCGQTPSFPADAIGATRNSYDGAAAGTAPAQGNVTKVETADSRPAAAPAYVTTATSRYDVHGRVVEATDAMGGTTRTAYTPAVGGPTTQTVVTTPPTIAVPAGMSTTTTIEPAIGQPTLVVDANNRRTELTYDALGRKAEVWLPNRTRSPSRRGSVRFAYEINKDRPTVITTTAIGPAGEYTSTNELFDGLLRTRQVQAPAVGGGRLLTDTRYDSHGRAYKTTQPFYNEAAVDGTLWVAADSAIDGLTRAEFDGAGRPVAQVYQQGATERWRTTTAYGGDRVHVTPPRGDTATTSISDARGRTVELRQYAAPTPTGSYDSTRYAYTAAGTLSQVTDAAGNTWRYGHDLRGRQTRTEDPDKGVVTSTYDNAGRLTATTDARGVTLAYSYDSMGRRTGTFLNQVGGTKLAEWNYDTAGSGKGHLASATRWVGDVPYTSSVYSYTSLYLPTEIDVTIPAQEGELAGTYAWFGSYGLDGSLSGETYPATDDLPAETVNYVLDAQGRTLSSSGAYNGTVELVTATNFTRYGEPERVQLGGGTSRAWLSYYYADDTRRLERSIVDAEVPRPMLADVNYTYDPAGNVTSIADKPLETTADVQCFRYDHLRRMTDAWTPSVDTWSDTTGCTEDPSTAGLSGPAPYWHAYDYDQVGNRTAEVRHDTGGDTTRTYDYPDPGAPLPHALSSVTTTRPGTLATTDTFGYDQVGNTRTRTGGTFTWDEEGHLATSTVNGQTTSYVYGADGQRLLRKDAGGTTLYLGKQEIRLAAGSTSTVGTRYYTHNGRAVAVRKGAKLTWLANDAQSSPRIAVASDSLQVTRRRQLPFGGPRGAAVPDWPGEKGFVGGTQDPSGLTHLGAREYDPDLGRFLSVDPVMDLNDPQQINAYAYGNNSPATNADPSGRRWCSDDQCTEWESNGVCHCKPPAQPLSEAAAPSIPKQPKATKPGGIRNQDLNGILDKVYPVDAGDDWVGNGKTSEALRNEFKTGRPTKGSYHAIPALDNLSGLLDIIEEDDVKRAKGGSLLTSHEREVAIKEARELWDALSMKDQAGVVTRDIAADPGRKAHFDGVWKAINRKGSFGEVSDALYNRPAQDPKKPEQLTKPTTKGFMRGMGALSILPTAIDIIGGGPSPGATPEEAMKEGMCMLDVMGACGMYGPTGVA